MKKFNMTVFISLILFYCTLFNAGAVKNKSNNSSSNKDNSELSFVISNDTKENSGELDFIKSKVPENTLLANNKVLLYGGILLISASIIGIVFTVIPRAKKRKSHIYKNESINRVKSKKRSKRGKSL